MIRPIRMFAAAAVFVSLSACGEVVSVDAEFDAAPAIDAEVLGPCEVDDIKIDNLFECFLQAQCKYGIQCEGFGGTVEECVASFREEGDFQRILDATEAGKTIYDGKEAADCLQILRADICPEDPERACDEVFAGTVPDGEFCFRSDECSGQDADCRRDSCPEQCCAGVCENTAGIGDDCSTRSCERGARCVNLGVDRLCVSGDAGTDCGDDYDCDYELFCSMSGKCMADLALDKNCVRNEQCHEPATCVGESGDSLGVCQTVDSVGVDCDGDCDGNLYCASDEDTLVGICKTKLIANSGCTGNGECEEGLLCHPNSQTCTPRPALNQPCVRYACQEGLFCTAELDGVGILGECAEPVVNGLDCNSDDHCESDVCANNKCEEYLSCYL